MSDNMENKNTVQAWSQHSVNSDRESCAAGSVLFSSHLREKRKESILSLRCGVIPLCGRLGRLRRCTGAATPVHRRILFS